MTSGDGQGQAGTTDSVIRPLGAPEPDDYAKAFSMEGDEGLDFHIDPGAEPEPDVDFGPLAGWRPAKCLDVLKAQVNARWPNRRVASDGMIGDDRHCGPDVAKPSDHCPKVRAAERAS